MGSVLTNGELSRCCLVTPAAYIIMELFEISSFSRVSEMSQKTRWGVRQIDDKIGDKAYKARTYSCMKS